MPQNPYLLRLHQMFAGATFTQRFGCTGLTLEPAYGNCPHFHRGIDFVVAGGYGAEVYAPASGVVTRTNFGGLGNSIEIQAPNGFKYILGHMAHGLTLKPGDKVLAGQFVGEQGNSGSVTGTGPHPGTHVHLEIIDPQGRPVDPAAGAAWNDWRSTWWGVFHSLGLGSGFNPGQSITTPPDPDTPGWGGTTFPIPFINGRLINWNDINGDPNSTLPEQPGETDPYNFDFTGQNTNGGINLGSVFSAFTTGGGILGQAQGNASLVGEGQESQGDCSSATLVIALIGIGVIFLIMGLVSLTKEEPVKVVSQPVSDAIQPVRKVVTIGAKVAGAVK